MNPPGRLTRSETPSGASTTACAEDTYVHWIKRFIYFQNKRHPRDLGEAEVTAFLKDLARERGVTAATQNQVLSALSFL